MFCEGPNTATGHGSVIFTEEVQVNYIMQIVKPILKGLATSFEPTDTASDTYNQHVQSKLSNSVWSGCSSWYRTNGGKGKITGLFPGTFAQFWWTLRTPVWNDFKVVGGSRWERRRTLSKVVNTLVGLGLAGAGWYAYQNPESVRDYWAVAREHVSCLTYTDLGYICSELTNWVIGHTIVGRTLLTAEISSCMPVV